MPPTPRPLTLPRPAAAVGAALALAAALATSACGDQVAPAPAATGTPAGTASRPADTASALTRTGGVAGFADDLAVAADGHVTGSTRSGPVDCRVPAATAATLATAPAPTVPPAAGTDRMTVAVERAAGTAGLGEAQGSDPLSTTARQLLDDVQLPQDQHTVCR